VDSAKEVREAMDLDPMVHLPEDRLENSIPETLSLIVIFLVKSISIQKRGQMIVDLTVVPLTTRRVDSLPKTKLTSTGAVRFKVQA
jgi:hypothetical protein